MTKQDKYLNIARDHIHNWIVDPELEDAINAHGDELERLVSIMLENVVDEALKENKQ